MNILFVSIAFPPKNDPESLQTAKYYKYLSKLFKVDILTSALPTLFMPADDNLKKYLKNYRQLIEIPIKENKYINGIIRKIAPYFLESPDSKYSFFKQWKKAAAAIKNKPDLVYSRSYPLSSAFMAKNLADHYQVPWIMHLSDLWADCPINDHAGTVKQFHEEKEKEYFNSASFICLTSLEQVNFYRAKYPALSGKFQFMPNVYDPDDIVAKEYKPGPTLKFLYTGGLAGERSPEFLLKAIDTLHRQTPAELKDTEFIFAGQFDRQNEKHFRSCDLPMVKNLGLLPYSDALHLQNEADILMIIDTPFSTAHEAMFFPSKVLDYIIARKRMMALTNPGSTVYNIVNGKYGDCVAYNDVPGIIGLIRKAVQQHKDKNPDYFSFREIDHQYAADVNAARLAKLMLSSISEKTRT